MLNETQHRLLLDIDALFDTRMGTLVKHWPDVARSIDVVSYRKRTEDKFDDLTGGVVKDDEFQTFYRQRDLSTLKRSMVTGIVPTLMTYLNGLDERFIKQIDASEITIDLNIHPFNVPAPVAEEIAACLYVLLPEYVSVRLTNLNPLTLSPKEFINRYNGWITYDFHPWLERHKFDLLNNHIPGLAVILPKLTLGELREYDEEGNKLPDAFIDSDKHGLLEMIMEDFIHLEHIPVEDYCFMIPGMYQRSQVPATSSPDTDAANSS